MKLVLAVAIGGAAGAVGRYYLAGLVARWLEGLIGAGFPYGTLAVNVVGSFAMGALIESFATVIQASPELRALLLVGVLGGFTTFSAFSADTYLLIERAEIGRAALYIGLSVLGSLGGFFVGLRLLRWVFA